MTTRIYLNQALASATKQWFSTAEVAFLFFWSNEAFDLVCQQIMFPIVVYSPKTLIAEEYHISETGWRILPYSNTLAHKLQSFCLSFFLNGM